ncbi:MAG: shikimate dehydrogenase [Eubacteriales bacterium]
MKMKINGRTKVCGVIGKPIAHTMSPVIHNTLACELQVNLAYLPFLVEENIASAIEGAYHLGMLGLNVTVPYKSDVIGSLSEIDELAEKIGAVNTLVRQDTGYKGYNTDLPGLYRAMESDGVHIAGEEMIVLGAGGAARAVAFMCAAYGVKKLYLLNRNVEKARLVAKEVNDKSEREFVIPMALEEYPQLPNKKMIAIQATSVGLSPNVEDVVIADSAFYDKIHTGYDLIYKPTNTKFMELVKANGGVAYHGLKMLLYQGIIAFELWNETIVPEDLVNMVYQKMKEEMGINE